MHWVLNQKFFWSFILPAVPKLLFLLREARRNEGSLRSHEQAQTRAAFTESFNCRHGVQITLSVAKLGCELSAIITTLLFNYLLVSASSTFKFQSMKVTLCHFCPSCSTFCAQARVRQTPTVMLLFFPNQLFIVFHNFIIQCLLFQGLFSTIFKLK